MMIAFQVWNECMSGSLATINGNASRQAGVSQCAAFYVREAAAVLWLDWHEGGDYVGS